MWALLLVQRPLSMVGMAPHNFQELVGTCWSPFGSIWDKDCMVCSYGSAMQRLDAGLRMNQRHIEWKIGLIPGHWPFAFEAIRRHSQTVRAVPIKKFLTWGRCTISGIET